MSNLSPAEAERQVADSTGTVADTKVVDPDADTATVIALLRGILEALNTIATNTGS